MHQQPKFGILQVDVELVIQKLNVHLERVIEKIATNF